MHQRTIFKLLMLVVNFCWAFALVIMTCNPGARRFGKLWGAARDGNFAPPVDLRYLQGPQSRVGNDRSAQVRGDIYSFLQSIYDSVAETLPDFKDELGSSETVRVCLGDPCAEQMRKCCEKDVEDPVDADLHPRKKPRKNKHQVAINQARTVATMEERWLPPGSMKEYFDQYLLQSGLEKPGSFASFWRVPRQIVQVVFLKDKLIAISLVRIFRGMVKKFNCFGWRFTLNQNICWSSLATSGAK